MENLAGRTAFITGGASGIGLGMARQFLAAGMKVAIADVRDDHLDTARAIIGDGLLALFLRLDVTDRFPMLGFTIRTDSPPRVAEVVLATDPALFAKKEGRTPSNFYTSREHGLLSVPRGEAVYVVPPEVLARFIAWFDSSNR